MPPVLEHARPGNTFVSKTMDAMPPRGYIAPIGDTESMRKAEASSEVAIANGFMTTRWSVVARATTPAAESQAALEELCRAYWFPVYAYARKHGCNPADAEDLTQEFFAEIIRTQFLQRADRRMGSFRSYLLGSVHKRVLNARVRSATLKRGGGATIVSIDEPLAEEQLCAVNDPALDPSQAYELSWALTVLQRTRERLVAEQDAKGRQEEFERFEPFLSAPPSEGEYAALAAKLGVSRNSIAVSIHRLGRRYRELLRDEVSQTVTEADEVEEEFSWLLKVLSR